MDDQLIGRTIGGYRLDRLLGRGGMATVYLAWDAKLQRQVVVKIMSPFNYGDESFQARFQQEALATARLDHPNIVHIYDYGQDGTLAYMVMEYLPGGSLHDRLVTAACNQQRVDSAWAVGIIQQIAYALEHAHRSGIIHRDVKPSNIMFAKDGRPVLTDLGIAKALHGPKLTKAMTAIGTPEYMSPEQGRGDPIDSRSDLYSLGVVLYELLAGTLPYPADTPWGIIFKHMAEPLPPLQTFNPAVSPALRSVVEKALAKRPADRFQSGLEMAEALRRARERPSQVLYAPPPPPPATSDSETRVISTAGPTSTEGEAASRKGAARPARARQRRRAFSLVPVFAGGAVVILAVIGVAGMTILRGGQRSEAAMTPAAPPTEALSALARSTSVGNEFVTATGTALPENAVLDTAEPAATVTPEVNTPSPTPPPSATETASPMPPSQATATSTPTATFTPVPTATATATSTPSNTPTPRPTVPPTFTPLPLVAPDLIEPPDGFEAFGQVALKWSAVPGAQAYQIQTRSDLQDQQAWRDWHVDGTATEYVLYFEGVPDYFSQPGTVYTWRVVAVGPDDRLGTVSNERHFRFQRRKPSPGGF